MGANTDPIYSRIANIDGNCILTTAAADYTGVNVNNQLAFVADSANGSFVQRLRFKALGTNVATVARIFLVTAADNLATAIAAVTGTPTGTPSGTGGTLQAGNYYAKVYAQDEYGKITAASAETLAVAVTGSTGSIAWAWTAVAGAAGYIVAVGQVSGGQREYFITATNALTQTAPSIGGKPYALIQGMAPIFYGEISLPATTASATAATPDVDYPMNFALPPSMSIYVGLGTAVAAGWAVSTIAGSY